jgi:hypothetical protein
MPLDHFSIVVPNSKLDGVAAFLTSSLHHMGFKEYNRPIPTVIGMGDKVPFLWLAGLDPKDGDVKTQEAVVKRQHIAFTAESQSSVLALPFVQPFGLSSFGHPFPHAVFPDFHAH